MSSASPAPCWYLPLKGALFALLAWNTATYLDSGTPSEALDSIAWLTLLVLFELETGDAGRLGQGRAMTAIRGIRMVAAAALIVALAGYIREQEWLDALNVGLWIAVVALLEFEVRRAEAVMRHRRWFTATAAVVYSGLLTLVVTWLWQGKWFDAYDAALWIVAFATIEMNLLGDIRKNGATAG